jgi:hypothetical protein
LSNIGSVYYSLSQFSKALTSYEQSLPLVRAAQDKLEEVTTLNRLAVLWHSPKNASRNPTLAILYGKMAVNLWQGVRRDNRGLSKELQQSLLDSQESLYRRLADLLIAEGRLFEGQQVLDLLKEQEAFDFVRRDSDLAKTLDGRADLTDREKKTYEAFVKVADEGTRLGTKKAELLKVRQRTAEQEAEIAILEKQRCSLRPRMPA